MFAGNSWNSDHGVSHTIISNTNARLAGGTCVWPGAMRKANLTLCQSHSSPLKVHPFSDYSCMAVKERREAMKMELYWLCEISLKVGRAERWFGAGYYLFKEDLGREKASSNN